MGSLNSNDLKLARLPKLKDTKRGSVPNNAAEDIQNIIHVVGIDKRTSNGPVLSHHQNEINKRNSSVQRN